MEGISATGRRLLEARVGEPAADEIKQTRAGVQPREASRTDDAAIVKWQKGSSDQEATESATTKSSAESDLSSEERKELEELRKRDQEVRAHEQAHAAALGAYKAGGITLSYETGPDGRQYAVSGETPVDLSEESTPEKTIQKMEVIKRAAYAPTDPSAADHQIAAQATQIAAQARTEIAKRTESDSNGEPLAQDLTNTAEPEKKVGELRSLNHKKEPLYRIA